MISLKVTYLLYSLSKNIHYKQLHNTDSQGSVYKGSTLHGFCVIIIVVHVGASE